MRPGSDRCARCGHPRNRHFGECAGIGGAVTDSRCYVKGVKCRAFAKRINGKLIDWPVGARA